MKKKLSLIAAVFVLLCMTACSDTVVPDSSHSTTTITTTTINTTTASVVTPSEISSVITTSAPEIVTENNETEIIVNTTMLTTTATVLYSESDSSSSVVATVPIDTEVIVTGSTVNGYVPVVTTTGESGYVSSTSLTQENIPTVTTTTKGKETTTTSKGNITTAKATTTTATTTKKKTTTTTVKKTTTTIKTTTTKKTTTTAGTTLYKEITPKTMYVVSGGVTLLREPSQNAGKLLVLPAGTAVNVVGETGNWYAISYSGKIVFANKSYFSSTKPATTTTTTTTEPSTPSTPYYDYDAASEMCGLVNELRAEWGRNELEVNEALMEAARVRAKELAEKFSHNRPNGEGGISVISDYILGTWYRGENIGKTGILGPSYMFKGFKDSEGHMGTMISSEFTMMGIGCYIVKDEEYGYIMYCCQLFAGYDN